MIDSESQHAPLTIRLFGPMQVKVGDNPLPHFRSRKALWLLALLTLRAGRPVEREWLSGMLWPDIDESKAGANLRVVLSELRQALGHEGRRLHSPNRHTIELDLSEADVDVTDFDQAIRGKEPAALARAVDLHRKPLLEGCTEEWAAQERIGREYECVRALQTLANSAYVAAKYETAIGYYRRALGLDPLSESSLYGLMEALSRSGDINAALYAYRAFARLLQKDNPKATPGAKTNGLYTRLRTDAGRKASRSEATAGRGNASTTPRSMGSLPHMLTQLIGREDERTAVAAQLRSSRLVTLTGLGGIGKTRLAIGVAEDLRDQYLDGAWLVALESLSSGTQVPEQIADVLGVKPTKGHSLLDSVAEYLRAKQTLLVLDNCEHLLAPAASVAFHLLRECAGLRILATSRETLGILGESVWLVPGLAIPDLSARLPTGHATLVRVMTAYESVQLFAERARSAQQAFEVTGDNAAIVAQICARLEGIPLAIELAAPRVRVLSLEQINVRLDNHLALLTGGSQMAAPRHHTLRAALNWSYELLNDAERLLLGRISVFVGGWDLEAAENVCAGDGIESAEVLNLLTSLVDKSVVKVEKASGNAIGRYRLLESVRQYATERLQASAGSESVRRRHLTYFLALAEAAEPELRGSNQAFWLQRLQAEYDNIRAALAAHDSNDSSCGTDRLRLASALTRFWIVQQRHHREGRRLVDAILAENNQQERTAARAKGAFAAGTLSTADDDNAAAVKWYEESLSIFEDLQDRLGAARALERIGNAVYIRGDHVAAMDVLERVLPTFREFGDKAGIAETLTTLGHILKQRSEFQSAQACYEESLKLYEDLGDIHSAAWLLTAVGSNFGSLLRFEECQSCLERSFRMFEEVGDRKSMAMVIDLQGVLAYNSGDLVSALPYLEHSVSIHREMDNRRALAWSLANLGVIRMELSSDASSARSAIEESLAIFEHLGNQHGVAATLSYLAEAESKFGNCDRAISCFLKSLTLCSQLHDKATTAMILSGLASIYLSRNQAAEAAKLFAAATSVRNLIGAPLPANEQREFDQRVNKAAGILEAENFAAAWAKGSAMTWEETVDFALGLGKAS